MARARQHFPLMKLAEIPKRAGPLTYERLPPPSGKANSSIAPIHGLSRHDFDSASTSSPGRMRKTGKEGAQAFWLAWACNFSLRMKGSSEKIIREMF